jgi:hypothetical protein
VEGRPPTTLEAGDVLLDPAETIHAVKNVGAATPRSSLHTLLTTTLASAAPKACAIALPMPVAAPVTMATLELTTHSNQ